MQNEVIFMWAIVLGDLITTLGPLSLSFITGRFKK